MGCDCDGRSERKRGREEERKRGREEERNASLPNNGATCYASIYRERSTLSHKQENVKDNTVRAKSAIPRTSYVRRKSLQTKHSARRSIMPRRIYKQLLLRRGRDLRKTKPTTKEATQWL